MEEFAIVQIAVAEQYEAAHSTDQAKIRDLTAEIVQLKIDYNSRSLTRIEEDLQQAGVKAGDLVAELKSEKRKIEVLSQQLNEAKEEGKVLDWTQPM